MPPSAFAGDAVVSVRVELHAEEGVNKRGFRFYVGARRGPEVDATRGKQRLHQLLRVQRVDLGRCVNVNGV